MTQGFSGCEIVELSVQIEKNGKDFYLEIAKLTDDPDAKAAVEYLAHAEERHIKVFSEMFDATCEYSPQGAYPDEYFAFMNSLASSYVFTQKDKGKEIASKTKDFAEGINLGIQFEKDSILFYEGMRRILPGKDQEKIEQIIGEEKSHLRQLCMLKGGCRDEKG